MKKSDFGGNNMIVKIIGTLLTALFTLGAIKVETDDKSALAIWIMYSALVISAIWN